MTENDLRYNQDIYKIFAVYFSILLPSKHINNLITLMNYNTNESWFTVFPLHLLHPSFVPVEEVAERAVVNGRSSLIPNLSGR